MTYRDEVIALKSREDALEAELHETRTMRAAAERRSLPVLEDLRVASPCPEKWDDMVGDATTRFCTRCAKSVYDLSAMTREEAERFVRDRVGPVCVTLRRRSDGRVITNDCPVGVRRRRFGIGVVALAVTGAAAAFALLPDAGDLRCRAPGRPVELATGDDDRASEAREESRQGVEKSQRAMYDTVHTGVLAPSRHHGARTTGCLCAPGDPLCSCL